MSVADLRREILGAFAIENVTEKYRGPVEITDLKDALGTRGSILVVRGDLALADELPSPELATPKMWMYKELLRSHRLQEALGAHPQHKLFDGVGFSGLEALGFHANRLGRKAVAVMACEHVPDPSIFDRWDVEVIHGDGPMEKGYVEKQAEVLASRNDLIPCHQALYGAQALASVGNVVTDMIVDRHNLDCTFWCIAGGSNLYGIGRKIKQYNPRVETVVVEPETELTIDPSIDFHNADQVGDYARKKLGEFSSMEWDCTFSGVFPLHAAIPNRYLLHLWAITGDIGFDRLESVRVEDVVTTQRLVRELSDEWDWTRTTALTLTPAIQAARRGANVLVIAYGKNRENRSRCVTITGHWS